MKTPRVLNLTRLGWGLAVPVIVLASIGIASIHATDRARTHPAETTSTNGLSTETQTNWLNATIDRIGPLALRQGAYLITGVVILFATLRMSYRRIGRRAYLIYGAILFLLLLLFLDRYFDLPLIPVKRHTRRWIELGPFGIQPSEFMKVGLILALAFYLRYRKSYRTWRGLVPPFLLTLAPMLLILRQPDLGTLLMLLPVLFVMLFVAGARLRHLTTIVLLGCATLPAFYMFGMKDYQRARVQVLFKQNTQDERWHTGPGYQLRQGLIALGTGRVTGVGYGEGAFVQYGLLPEEHNDFIFAVIGNQWGLIGCIVVILCYIVIIICGLEVAMVTNDPFGRLLAVGVVVMIVAQALLNICMNIGLAPITGMTLPFVSFGGSSLWANFLALGLLVNVAQRRPMLIARPPFEHEDD